MSILFIQILYFCICFYRRRYTYFLYSCTLLCSVVSYVSYLFIFWICICNKICIWVPTARTCAASERRTAPPCWQLVEVPLRLPDVRWEHFTLFQHGTASCLLRFAKLRLISEQLLHIFLWDKQKWVNVLSEATRSNFIYKILLTDEPLTCWVRSPCGVTLLDGMNAYHNPSQSFQDISHRAAWQVQHINIIVYKNCIAGQSTQVQHHIPETALD